MSVRITRREFSRVAGTFGQRLGTSQTPEIRIKTPMGSRVFIAELEKRTDGEILLKFVGGDQLCNELNCVALCREGTVDLFTTTTQNAAHKAPYMNALDFVYLLPDRAAQFGFFYHPMSEALFRGPIREFHKLQFLFTHCELRGIMMGKKYKNKPKILSIGWLTQLIMGREIDGECRAGSGFRFNGDKSTMLSDDRIGNR